MSGRDGEGMLPDQSKHSEHGFSDDERKSKAPAHMYSESVEMFPHWTVLSQDQINVLLDLSVDQIQLQFQHMLGLKKHQTCLKEATLLDYFVAGFLWAKERRFTCQQISVVMDLSQLVVDNIKDKQMPFPENFKVFTQKLLTTSKSPVDTDKNPLFDLDQIKSITDFFKSSLFQHYRLYQFLFFHPRDEVLIGMERSIEVANSADFAAPLEEGVPAEEYLRYMAPTCATLPAQALDECLEKNEENTADSQQRGGHGILEGFRIEDVREVLGEMTKEMLAKLQADFTEKLQFQEESYTSQLESLERVASK